MRKNRSRTRNAGPSMSRRTAVGLLLSGGAVIGFQQSGAFSNVSSDRLSSVETTDDNQAFLRIDLKSPAGTDGDRVELAELENQLSTPLDSIEVAAQNTGAISIMGIQHPSGLDPGEAGSVSAQINSDQTVTETVTLIVDAAGDEKSITAERHIDVTCDVPQAAGQPDACPVTPNITVEVGKNASDSRIQDGDIEIKNEDIDGDVVSSSGSDGDIGITNAEITGKVRADGEIGSVKNTNIGGNVRADGGGFDDSITNSAVGGDVITSSGSDGDIGVTNSEIGGKIDADGGVGSLKNTVVGGTVRANGDDVGDPVVASRVGGDLLTASGSDGDIAIKNSTVCGNVSADSEGEITNSAVGGNVKANGELDIYPGSIVFGNVSTDGDTTIENNVTVHGNIDSGSGSATISGTVEANLSAGGEVTVSGTVGGNLSSGSDVTVEGTVGGNLTAGGDVTVEGTVKGDVSAGGEVDGEGTIGGSDPRSNSD